MRDPLSIHLRRPTVRLHGVKTSMRDRWSVEHQDSVVWAADRSGLVLLEAQMSMIWEGTTAISEVISSSPTIIEIIKTIKNDPRQI